MSAQALLNTSLKSRYLAGMLLMSTGVVLEFARVAVMTNGLRICTSASLEACANAAAFTQEMLVAGDRGTEVSGTGVTNSNGTLNSVSFGGRNKMLLDTQSINGL